MSVRGLAGDRIKRANSCVICGRMSDEDPSKVVWNVVRKIAGTVSERGRRLFGFTHEKECYLALGRIFGQAADFGGKDRQRPVAPATIHEHGEWIGAARPPTAAD